MEIISKEQAANLGLVQYFTGKPCRNGHISPRTFSGNCLQCRREYRVKDLEQNKCPVCRRNFIVEGRTRCKDCLTKASDNVKTDYTRQQRREYRQRCKIEAFKAYGGVHCNCCGETNHVFLAIDHIAGNGNHHRKNVIQGGEKLYRWLKKNNYPPGYQVLCQNCNWGKYIMGVCPHQQIMV